MKSLGILLIALIVAGWIVAIAIFSIQNVFVTTDSATNQLISIRFLGYQTVEMPLGVALAFCLAAGIVGTAILIPIWNSLGDRPRRYSDDDLEDDF
jgi:hypothetical protein